MATGMALTAPFVPLPSLSLSPLPDSFVPGNYRWHFLRRRQERPAQRNQSPLGHRQRIHLVRCSPFVEPLLSDSRSCNPSDVIAGIDYAVSEFQTNYIPSVISLSLGGTFSTATNSAIERAVAAGVRPSSLASTSSDHPRRSTAPSLPETPTWTPAPHPLLPRPPPSPSVLLTSLTRYVPRLAPHPTRLILVRSEPFTPTTVAASTSSLQAPVRPRPPLPFPRAQLTSSDVTSAWIDSDSSTRTISGTSMVRSPLSSPQRR